MVYSIGLYGSEWENTEKFCDDVDAFHAYRKARITLAKRLTINFSRKYPTP
jgi:hypothetical protein